MPTIDVTPMTTPSTVSADRSLFVRSVSTAIDRTSREEADAEASDRHLFLPERFDRIERRRAHRRIQPEEHADDGRHAEAERHRPGLDARRQRRQRRRRAWPAPKPSSVPISPPTIDSVVDSVSTCQTMSRLLGAERLAQADLARALARRSSA